MIIDAATRNVNMTVGALSTRCGDQSDFGLKLEVNSKWKKSFCLSICTSDGWDCARRDRVSLCVCVSKRSERKSNGIYDLRMFFCLTFSEICVQSIFHSKHVMYKWFFWRKEWKTKQNNLLNIRAKNRFVNTRRRGKKTTSAYTKNCT